MSNDAQFAELREWLAQLRQLLKLRQGERSAEPLEALRKNLEALTAADSSLPGGMQKMLKTLATTASLEPTAADKEQQQVVDDFREQLLALTSRLAAVLQPDEVRLQGAWLKLSRQSCKLGHYELAMKALQDAWHQAQAIEAEKRTPQTHPTPQAQVLKPVVEQALKAIDALTPQLDGLEPAAQAQMLLMATLVNQAMQQGDFATAFALAGGWYKWVEDTIAAQGRQRAALLRTRIEDEVYSLNAELKTLGAPLAAVSHSDDFFGRDRVDKAEWNAALQGVLDDRKTVAAAVEQARLDAERQRADWAEARRLAELQLQALKAVVTDPAGAAEADRLDAVVDGVDLARLGLNALRQGIVGMHGLASGWLKATESNTATRELVVQRKLDLQQRLERVSLEAPTERAALDLQRDAALQLADARDWTPALAGLDAALKAANEKIKAQRALVEKAIGKHCEADFVGQLFDKLGAAGSKKLLDAVGAKALGDLSKQFSADELDAAQKEAGGGKALKAVLDDVCGGQAADLKGLRASFGTLAPLVSTVQQAFDGKGKTVGTLLKTGFGGDAGKLKTFLDGYPPPDAALLKAKDPAALAAQQEQDNLKKLVVEGGLNDNPEVLAHLVGTGCDGDPVQLKALHAQFSSSTPPGLAGVKALLDSAGLKVPPERLAEILKTGCAGSAENLKNLAIGFDGKMPRLKEMVGQWGGDSGTAISGLVDARHLNGDYQKLQKTFADKLHAAYPDPAGAARRKRLIKAAPEFKRKVLPDNLNATLADKVAPKDENVGSFTGTDWNHLLTHVCERHLPQGFAFTGAKAAKTPINNSNSQLPASWTPQDIARLLQEALNSAECKAAVALSEAYADRAEAWFKRKDWEDAVAEEARWQAKADKHQQWLDHEDWSNNGGSRWKTYQHKIGKGERWRGDIPDDPGPEPPWPGKAAINPPGPRPPAPGAEPPVVPEPGWVTQTFWHGDIQFQLGVDWRDGRRQITQLFPLRSLGAPALTEFSERDMLTLRDATIA